MNIPIPARAAARARVRVLVEDDGEVWRDQRCFPTRSRWSPRVVRRHEERVPAGRTVGGQVRHLRPERAEDASSGGNRPRRGVEGVQPATHRLHRSAVLLARLSCGVGVAHPEAEARSGPVRGVQRCPTGRPEPSGPGPRSPALPARPSRAAPPPAGARRRPPRRCRPVRAPTVPAEAVLVEFGRRVPDGRVGGPAQLHAREARMQAARRSVQPSHQPPAKFCTERYVFRP